VRPDPSNSNSWLSRGQSFCASEWYLWGLPSLNSHFGERYEKNIFDINHSVIIDSFCIGRIAEVGSDHDFVSNV